MQINNNQYLKIKNKYKDNLLIKRIIYRKLIKNVM